MCYRIKTLLPRLEAIAVCKQGRKTVGFDLEKLRAEELTPNLDWHSDHEAEDHFIRERGSYLWILTPEGIEGIYKFKNHIDLSETDNMPMLQSEIGVVGPHSRNMEIVSEVAKQMNERLVAPENPEEVENFDCVLLISGICAGKMLNSNPKVVSTSFRFGTDEILYSALVNFFEAQPELGPMFMAAIYHSQAGEL